MPQRSERLVELFGGSEAVLSFLLERLQDRVTQLRQNPSSGIRLGERKGRLRQMGLEKLHWCLGHEGARAGQELVEDHSEAVEVAAAVELFPRGQRSVLLWRSVFELAQEHSG